MSADRELLELAAKAAGIAVLRSCLEDPVRKYLLLIEQTSDGRAIGWNPLTDDGDRLRLARQLDINIDFADCCAWKRLPDGSLYQEFWGGDCTDEAHAIVSVAAEIGRAQ